MDVDAPQPPPLRTRQVTRDLACPTTYFRLRMCVRSARSPLTRCSADTFVARSLRCRRRGPRRPSAALFRAALDEALLALHGAVGGAVALRVLVFEAGSGCGVVSLDSRDAHKLWPAAALLTQLRGEQCTLQARAARGGLRCAPRN